MTAGARPQDMPLAYADQLTATAQVAAGFGALTQCRQRIVRLTRATASAVQLPRTIN